GPRRLGPARVAPVPRPVGPGGPRGRRAQLLLRRRSRHVGGVHRRTWPYRRPPRLALEALRLDGPRRPLQAPPGTRYPQGVPLGSVGMAWSSYPRGEPRRSVEMAARPPAAPRPSAFPGTGGRPLGAPRQGIRRALFSP